MDKLNRDEYETIMDCIWSVQNRADSANSTFLERRGARAILERGEDGRNHMRRIIDKLSRMTNFGTKTEG